MWNQICKRLFSLSLSHSYTRARVNQKSYQRILKMCPLHLNRIPPSPSILSSHTLSLKICKALWQIIAFQSLCCCFQICLNLLSCTCCLHYTDLRNATLTYIFDSGSGMTWEPHGKCLLRLTKCSTCGERSARGDPVSSPLAESTPSAAESPIKSPCLVEKKLGWMESKSCLPWSDDNFLFPITIPSSNSASHLIDQLFDREHCPVNI